MKKLLKFLSILIIFISVMSCNEKKASADTYVPAETERAIVIKDTTAFKENLSKGFYHVVLDNETLDGIMDKYLNNRSRWGELLVLNPYLGNDADKRSFRVPVKGGPGYLIQPGEIIFLPNDAIGALSNGKSRSAIMNLGNLRISDFIRDIPLEKDTGNLYTKVPKESTATIPEKSRSYFWASWPEWLKWLVLFFVIILIYHLTYPLFRNFRDRDGNNTSITNQTIHRESSTEDSYRDIEILGNKFIESGKDGSPIKMNYHNGSKNLTMEKNIK